MCTIFLIISACAFPLFFTVAVGIFAIVWFRGYYEIIPIAFLHDVLYGVSLTRFAHISYVMTIMAVVLVLASVIIRKQVFDANPRTI